MKLFLTSNGLSSGKLKEEFIDLAGDLPEKNILIVGYGRFIKWAVEEMKKFDFSEKNILSADISKKVDFSRFKDIDMIYLLGGDTFYILDQLRKSNFDDFLKKWKNKERIVLAISAGTIIAGPNIKIAEWGSEADDNYVHLKDLTGLNLTNIAIYVHYEDRLKGEIDDFKKIADYPVETLKDGEALIIIENKARKIR